jgi:hypothetical protein
MIDQDCGCGESFSMANHVKPPVGELTRLLQLAAGPALNAGAGITDPPPDNGDFMSTSNLSDATLSASSPRAPDMNVLLALLRAHPGLKITISY